MDRLLRSLARRGMRHGFRGGHPAWLAVGAAAWMVSRSRRQQDDVAYRTVMRPGERLVVTTTDPRAATRHRGDGRAVDPFGD